MRYVTLYGGHIPAHYVTAETRLLQRQRTVVAWTWTRVSRVAFNEAVTARPRPYRMSHLSPAIVHAEIPAICQNRVLSDKPLVR